MNFNTNNQNLRQYHFRNFLEDNYDELFSFYKDNFYNPETGEKSEEAFNDWTKKCNKRNPIEEEKQKRYIATRKFPIWVTYPNGNSKLQYFKHNLSYECWRSVGRYSINEFIWNHFSDIEPDKYEENCSYKIYKKLIYEIRDFIKDFGKVLYCIRGSKGIIVYYKIREVSDKLKVEKFRKKFSKEHNIDIFILPYQKQQGML